MAIDRKWRGELLKLEDMLVKVLVLVGDHRIECARLHIERCA